MVELKAKPQAVPVDFDRAAIVVVDMQNAFASKRGMLDIAGVDLSDAQRVVRAIGEVLAAGRRAGMQVVYLQMGYKPDLSNSGGPNSPNWHKELAMHLMNERPELKGKLLTEGTWDFAIVDELAPEEGDLVIVKTRYSGFAGTTLDSQLRVRAIRYLFFAGIATNVCVESTLRDAYFLDYWPILLRDGTMPAGDARVQEATLYNVESFFGWSADSNDLIATLDTRGEGSVWIVDIDVGGTLTDGLFTNGQDAICVKVDTTPHDLTACLFDCLTQGAAQAGFQDSSRFLEEIELIRWSTTITSNVLAESHGPRIGLLVSSGEEQRVYGKESRSIVLNRLVAEADVIGLGETADESEIMNAARSLLEKGVRRICVSLKDSHRNPWRELFVKQTIDQQYPDHFLGSVPVLAGIDISQSSEDETRSYCALINAYTHGALAATLFKAEDELRETGRYIGSFLVSHINGGVAGIAKTKAIDTIESGPILGIHGSAYLAKMYGLNDVIAMDIGGTTAKVSVLKNAEPIYRKPSDFFGISVGISLPYLRSIALGGGSVVKAPPGNGQKSEVELGPESMGSFPGPACYALGGDQATLTDAFVAAGIVNPEYFLGGTKPIDRELAAQTIDEKVARPLQISVEEACKAIIDRAFEMAAGMIDGVQAELQMDLSKHVLFAYGGNGGLFACGVAEKAGLKTVQLFSLGPVFSAFGSSVSGVSHVYERSLPEIGISEAGVARIRELLEDMKEEGIQDLLGEGIQPKGLSFAIELDMTRNGGRSVITAVAESSLKSSRDLKSALAGGLGGGEGADELALELIRLRVNKPMPAPRIAEQPMAGPDASHARVGTRAVNWGSKDGAAQIYRWESLRPGNRIEGCAVIEGINSTQFIPDGWVIVMDRFGNATVTRSAKR